jgi:hypothetical protein
MAQYVLNPSNFQAGQVGSLYNVGIGDGTNSYGYLFQNDPHKGMRESTDVTSKAALIQYSSSNLIDRDLVFFPRVTQGDYSGGGLQVAQIDLTKYFDSDLEIRTPGYLTLRPGWVRSLLASSSTGNYQSVNYNNDIFTCWGTSSIYNSAGTTFSPGFTCSLIDTDGSRLFVTNGSSLSAFNGSTFSALPNTLDNGPATQIWLINLGTSGRFMYYLGAPFVAAAGTIAKLYKLDMSTGVANGGVAVPLGSPAFAVVDICPYQTGIAILSQDSVGGGDSDVWFHDGQNLTRIVHLAQYVGVGITNCLGNLYVTATSEGGFEAPALFQISSGSIQVVSRFGTPLASSISSSVGAPIASGQYVYYAVINPQINNISSASYIGIYDALTQATSHLGNLDSLDSPPGSQPRQIAISGRAAAFPMLASGNSYLQYQTNTTNLVGGSPYATSGWLVSPKLDFSTPSISKRFRRIEVIHSPLLAGESILVNGYTDQDPLLFTTALTPVPTSATATNNTVGSSTTILTFGVDTIGKTLYYALNLMGNGTSTPKVRQVSIEIGGSWNWNFDFDCTNLRRRLDDASEDAQGVSGKDLYFLLRNAYENGTTVTLTLFGGLSYSAAIETLQADSVGYLNHQGTPVKADEEWLVNVVLRQIA